MLELCFYAEKRTSNGRDVDFRKWDTVCKAFGVDHCYVIDAVHLPFTLSGLYVSATIIKSFDEVPFDRDRVFVEKDTPPNCTAVPYYEFDHPEDALYCFGKDSRGMDYASADLDGDWIYIPSEEALWAEHAAAVVLADRSRHGNS